MIKRKEKYFILHKGMGSYRKQLEQLKEKYEVLTMSHHGEATMRVRVRERRTDD